MSPKANDSSLFSFFVDVFNDAITINQKFADIFQNKKNLNLIHFNSSTKKKEKIVTFDTNCPNSANILLNYVLITLLRVQKFFDCMI